MYKKAVVKQVIGDKAIIEIIRESSCKEGCGGDCLSCKDKKSITATAINEAGASVFDVVYVVADTKSVYFLAFLAYMLPLISAVAFYYIFNSAGFSEGLCALFAIIGFVIGYVPAFFANKFLVKKGGLTYVIKKENE